MIGISSKGDYKKTRDFLTRALNRQFYSDLDRYGRIGVSLLSSVTPKDSGDTAGSWGYRVISSRNPRIEWYNTNRSVSGTPIVIYIQYGHGTGTGGYVEGIDFINPAMRPLFQQIADDIWKKVTA